MHYMHFSKDQKSVLQILQCLSFRDLCFFLCFLIGRLSEQLWGLSAIKRALAAVLALCLGSLIAVLPDG